MLGSFEVSLLVGRSLSCWMPDNGEIDLKTKMNKCEEEKCEKDIQNVLTIFGEISKLGCMDQPYITYRHIVHPLPQISPIHAMTAFGKTLLGLGAILTPVPLAYFR